MWESHVGCFLAKIEEEGGTEKGVDLQAASADLAMDALTEFVLGDSVNCLGNRPQTAMCVFP